MTTLHWMHDKNLGNSQSGKCMTKMSSLSVHCTFQLPHTVHLARYLSYLVHYRNTS